MRQKEPDPMDPENVKVTQGELLVGGDSPKGRGRSHTLYSIAGRMSTVTFVLCSSGSLRRAGGVRPDSRLQTPDSSYSPAGSGQRM